MMSSIVCRSSDQRLAKIKNKTVRNSAQDQLEIMKHRVLSTIYGDLDKKEEIEKDEKVIKEQINKITMANR